MCADRATSGTAAAREVEIAAAVPLPGRFALPPSPTGIVMFAHGSGSSRLSPRNTQVAEALEQQGFGTLLFDLLTDPEARSRELVFDIPVLAERLVAATQWVADQPDAVGLPLGYFGASTGAAAALVAAAELRDAVSAVVSRGGRPDLAGESLARVTAATLLTVGGNDAAVLELNRRAQRKLRCENELVVVPGASHLFEEPGTLEAVIDHADAWFTRHLAGAPAA